MTAGAAAAWDRKADGTHIAVPIAGRDLDEVTEWLAENCEGDYLFVLGRRVVFQLAEDAALSTLWWRREER